MELKAARTTPLIRDINKFLISDGYSVRDGEDVEAAVWRFEREMRFFFLLVFYNVHVVCAWKITSWFFPSVWDDSFRDDNGFNNYQRKISDTGM